jgi:oligoribonuclease NrnB/cAMP/cGMP phosphodiesterase (DHH superfamily)
MKVFIWTDNDLDGAGSALALKLLYKDKAIVEIKDTYEAELNSAAIGWLPKIDQYDKVYVTDIGIAKDLVSSFDRENVVIIDHHQTHVDCKDQYKKAKTIIENYSSCTSLILNKFKNVFDKILSEKQTQLFNLIDDYDSYTLQYKDTLKLHSIFSTYNNPRVDKFIESFSDGMHEYSVFELNSIKLYFNKLKDTLNTQYFAGKIKNYKVISCIADFAINEVAHNAIKKYNADIAIIVNTRTGSVSFRKSKTCEAKLNVLAESLCNGGGHEYAAGGKITPIFEEFTKKLQPC